MCLPSAPKAPPPQPEQDEPRYLLSRDQFDELGDSVSGADSLMIRRRRGAGGSTGGNRGGGGAGLALNGGTSQGVMY